MERLIQAMVMSNYIVTYAGNGFLVIFMIPEEMLVYK